LIKSQCKLSSKSSRLTPIGPNIYLLEDEDSFKVEDMLVSPETIAFLSVGHGDPDEIYTRNIYEHPSRGVSPRGLIDAMGRKNTKGKGWQFIININCYVNKGKSSTKRFYDLVTINGFYWGYSKKVNLSTKCLNLSYLWTRLAEYCIDYFPFEQRIYIDEYIKN